MIYEMAPAIAANVHSPLWLAGMWLFGGAISLIGALCYAELATAWPTAGGDYVYLTRAFGRPMGFLFGWAQLWIVRPGSLGALAYVFARYADQLVPLGGGARGLMVYAAGAIIVLTLVNMLGVREGKWTQNILTALKVLGLGAIVAVGVFHSSPAGFVIEAPGDPPDLRLALIFIFIAYGGWNEMAYVAAEVRDPRRNILRSLVLGTVAVTLIYLVLNVAFVHALGFHGARQSHAIAADVMRLAAGPKAAGLISALICITALGGINGMIFTGARISYALGTEHRLFAVMGRWDKRRGTPIRSLTVQAIITLTLVVAFGWKHGGFDSLVNFTTPVFWIFFLLIGASLFVLRVREPHASRPYRVPMYPLIPAVFCASSAFMLWASVSYALAHRSAEAFWSIGVLGVGVVLCGIRGRRG